MKPSAFAVLRLITSSTLVLCWTGRSAGFAPLRIRGALHHYQFLGCLLAGLFVDERIIGRFGGIGWNGGFDIDCRLIDVG